MDQEPGGRCRAVVVVATMAAGRGASHSSPSSKPTAGRRTLLSPFTVAARYSAKSLGLSHPSDLAVGSEGDVYITDDSQRVAVISPDGKVLRRWGKPGSAPGEFHFVSTDPTDSTAILGPLTVAPNGLVYVSDSGNGRVEAFTPKGRFVRQFGSLAAGKGQFAGTFDLVVDSAGNAYVLDDQIVGVIDKFSPTGRFLWQIGGAASTDPDLAGHHHLASIDSHGRLVILNEEGGRVIYLDRDGHKLDEFSAGAGLFPSGSGPCEVTVDAAGNTYVSGCGRGGSCVAAVCAGTLVFDRAHRLIAEFADPRVPLYRSPRFGPDGGAFALGQDGSLIKLRITLPGA